MITKRGRSRERDQRSRSPPQDPRDDRRYTRPQEPGGDYYGRPAERQDTYRNTGSYGGDRGGYWTVLIICMKNVQQTNPNSKSSLSLGIILPE